MEDEDEGQPSLQCMCIGCVTEPLCRHGVALKIDSEHNAFVPTPPDRPFSHSCEASMAWERRQARCCPSKRKDVPDAEAG